MRLRTPVMLVAAALATPSLAFFGFRSDLGRRAITQSRVWTNMLLVRAQGVSFDGLVAHQEDRNVCDGKDGCISRAGLTSVIAVDKDGAVSERLIPNDLEAEQWNIHGRGVMATGFPGIGKYYAVRSRAFDHLRTRSSMLNPARDCNVAMDGTPQDYTVLGIETIFGYRTVKLRHNRADSTAWLAPTLGCFVLQAENRFKRPKPGLPDQVVRKTTTSLILGPPAGEYFSFPSQFAHESPLTVWEAQALARGRPSGTITGDATLQRLEAKWAAETVRLNLHEPVQ